MSISFLFPRSIGSILNKKASWTNVDTYELF